MERWRDAWMSDLIFWEFVKEDYRNLLGWRVLYMIW